MKTITITIFIALLATLFVLVFTNKKNVSPSDSAKPTNVKNISYSINGETFTLKNGIAEKSYGQNSATKNILRIFGEPAYADLDMDGDLDAALLLINEPGGSGTFYYAVLAINKGDNSVSVKEKDAQKNIIYKSTNVFLLGDRIVPEPVVIQNGVAVYNYTDRSYGDSMLITPYIKKSISINFDSANNKIYPLVNAVYDNITNHLSESEALTIAAQNCIKGGESLSNGIYNAGTKTWWFDANLNAMRPGCNPACVVSEDTRTAEINWRCTGLLNDNNKPGEQVACTMDAKQCPDGSYVGRSGPNCEFAPCP